ncbi:Fur family iron response transcriptional regulator [Rhodoblastus acidophilus]|uniref:iron response transcriptional regulator IrrA n=1 Tax=Rhodoblastus acidophilus TaxID=1074 RepID=UPI00160DD68C|nr:Fur family transcriptional regulator [Rhodoblastus acidophilus]MCW2286407.1 Fur family iron response transcriptional regulator [Rhodoblastus acidophilus]MCW2335256.1 Fur family iron response transcriptional regulator [Rhodoblastus acidophilus]
MAQSTSTLGKPARPTYDWVNGALARLVRDKLRAVDLRPTRQRVSIASLLFVAGDRHVTAEQVFAEAQALKMPLSRATVYNTLHQFADAGLVREIALYGSKVWYDTKTGSHCHYYDEDRSVLFDMEQDVTHQLQLKAPKGKRIVGVDVIVRVADDN